ncbi:hypothetical protein [Mesoterricola sediminis]|uniref:Uncharacterized protein n=1 Tax=Mesoterricola sediminis TaxID=2927980 RepID=A0AA48GXB2_9BACT|nr:hypothetical protein [Mesoterricola sediminis]BDU75767.1 hypothetical protein METESE_07250 [Mesoterricola sediminis]
MHRFNWAPVALAAGLSLSADPLAHALPYGVFTPQESGEKKDIIHPLPPLQRLAGLASGKLRVEGPGAAAARDLPVFTGPDAAASADLPDLREDGGTFVAAVDLTGSGLSDLIYAAEGTKAWGLLTNGARLSRPVQGFVAERHAEGTAPAHEDSIPADNTELKVDGDLLAAVGDFLGNGTEQLAWTRPGFRHVVIVGAHGVTTMAADLQDLKSAGSGARSHWLFAFKSNRKGQRTRLAYYRAGADHLVRLVPKGMAFTTERVPLKANWERLNQAVLDWPVQARADSDEKAVQGK